MKKRRRMVNRTFYLPERDLEFLERLVKEGYYASVSDAVRYAVKQLVIIYSLCEKGFQVEITRKGAAKNERV